MTKPASQGIAVPGAFAIVKLVLHLLTSHGYGYFRDELYYLACAARLDWGYVDHPPLSVALLALNRALLGDSLPALRFLPALAGAAVVFVTGTIARDLGGGRFAQALACVCALVAPAYLALSHFYSMNVFDVLLWSLGSWLVVRIVGQESPGLWPVLGAVVGLGLLNKLSMLWFVGGLGLGLLATRERRLLLTRGPVLAALVATALYLPHVLWQIRHGFPTLEFMHNATSYKMASVSVPKFLCDQLLIMQPLNAIVWMAGLGFALRGREGSPDRILGVSYLAVFALLARSGTARAAYLSPAYPPLFALGALGLERVTSTGALARLARILLVALLVLSGAALLALAVPVLPVARFVWYSAALGLGPRTEERKQMGELPQLFADMFGWPELAAEVARVFHTLPPEEQARASVYAQNYGEAGAIDFFGPRLGLPPAISGHNNYWLWGPGERPADTLLIVGGDPEDHRKAFEEVTPAGRHTCRYCMPYENDLTIWIARRPKAKLEELWPMVKHYD